MRATNKRLTACSKIFDPMSLLRVGRAAGSQPGLGQMALGYDGDRKTSSEDLT
jgi:hypothetical protein